MIAEHRPVVEALRDALLERDELIGEEILDTIRTVDARPGDSEVVVIHLEEPAAAVENQSPVPIRPGDSVLP
jgi:hypothetical protein